MKRTGLFIGFVMVLVFGLKAKDDVLKGSNYSINVRADGSIGKMVWNEKDSVPFIHNGYVGPAFYGIWDDASHEVSVDRVDNLKFKGQQSDLLFTLSYLDMDGVPAVKFQIKNVGYTTIQPQKVGVRLGLNNYMEKYPDWRGKFFPTMMRCEKTHFWAYAMAPNGNILCMASPDPVASWSNDFTKSWGEPDYKWHGHRITSTNIDLLNALPLPDRHPNQLYQLKPGEERSWTIYLQLCNQLQEVPELLSQLSGAAFVNLPVTTVAAGEHVSFSCVTSDDVEVSVTNPLGEKVPIVKDNKDFVFSQTQHPGVYTILCETDAGQLSTAKVTVRMPWNWYLKQARLNALKYPARATTHCETWYGLYSLYLAEKHFSDNELLQKTEERFNNIFPQLYDASSLEPTKIPHRIQNTSTMIGVLVDRYQATGKVENLEMAAGLADWIIAHAQSDDGAYRAGDTHYTSVIYPAKSIMELINVEKELAEEQDIWEKRWKKHYQSVKRAIDDLALHKDNIDTEGQLTYEDGMISCSALQLGMFALMQDDDEAFNKYKQPALELLEGHSCLTQLLIPDSRMRNGTLRFWEAQYDVYIQPNMFNSPHGWTSWRTYATYYAYLMTGEEQWLTQTFNALGSAMQMISHKTGDLRWAFVSHPYVPVIQTSTPHEDSDPDVFSDGHFHPLKYPHRKYVLGEQYVEMISDWIRANSQDNDVHEHFKCMEEIALCNAFVIEREDGTIVTYNCHVSESKGRLTITPAEAQITRLHYNLKKKYRINFGSQSDTCKGVGWL